MFTITNGFTYIAFLMFLAGGLLALEKYTKWKVFNVVPPLVWIYVLNMIFCTMGLYASDACSAVYSALKNNLLYAMMLPITSMSIDEKSHFERYAMTMPVTRTSMALSKYVFGVFCSLILAVLGFAASLIIGDDPAEALLSCAACFCVGLVFMSVLLPLIYKLGVEKARLSMMAIFVVFLIIFAFVLERMGVELDNITDALMVLPLVTLAVMAVSMCISVGIYRRKEF